MGANQVNGPAEPVSSRGGLAIRPAPIILAPPPVGLINVFMAIRGPTEVWHGPLAAAQERPLLGERGDAKAWALGDKSGERSKSGRKVAKAGP